MKIINKSLFGLCCFLSIVFTVCEAKEPSISSPYPVYDSGAWADYLNDPQINWIDNNRILFKSVKDNDKRRVSSGPFNLSFWEIGKEVRAYTPYVKRVSACANNGIVKYTLEEESGRHRVFYGKFGEEKEITPPKLSYPDLVKNCRIADNPEIVVKRQNNRAIIPLLDRHGYLELGPSLGKESSDNNPITLHHPSQSQGIALSLRRQEPGLFAPEYYAFKDAYFIQPIILYRQGRDKPATVWWMSPDGSITELKIPVGPWVKGGSVWALPTAKGIFLIYHGHKSRRDPGPAGGYLVQGEKYFKVIDGDIRGPAVSPDGCKAAISHAPYSDADSNTKDPNYRTLKVINFCPEEKNHAR
jgi:hypothetical protein